MTTGSVEPRSLLFERVARFADQLEASASLADRDSLTHASELSDLYESRVWVAEWLAQAPIKERPAYTGGRKPEADNKNRFSQWLAWKLEATGHRKIVSQYTYRLLNAHEIHEQLSPRRKLTVPDSEAALRPLNWLLKYKYQRFVDEVWARAVELADGGTVTSEHTKAALAEWKKANAGAVLVATQSSRSERDRQKAQAAVEVLISHGDLKQLTLFNNWVAPRLDKAFTDLDTDDE